MRLCLVVATAVLCTTAVLAQEEFVQISKTDFLHLMVSERIRARTGHLRDRLTWTIHIYSAEDAPRYDMGDGDKPGILVMLDHPPGTDVSVYLDSGGYKNLQSMVETSVRWMLERYSWEDDYYINVVYQRAVEAGLYQKPGDEQ
jgi:hypothetical protein